MKRYSTLFAAGLFSLSTLFTAASATPKSTDLNSCPTCLKTPPTETMDWSKFSKGVKVALTNDNLGIRQSALQQVIGYGDQLNIDRNSIFEIVKIYRNSTDESTRIMALAALNATQDPWALDFLKRSVRTENSAHVANLTQAVLENELTK